MFLDTEGLLFKNDSVTITSADNNFLITFKYGEDSWRKSRLFYSAFASSGTMKKANQLMLFLE